MIKLQDITQALVKHRWLWHLGYWLLYTATRAVSYYITVLYYDRKYLEFMLITEGAFVAITYFTLWLYKFFFSRKSFGLYFLVGFMVWIVYIGLVIVFQKFYLKDIPAIANATFWDIYLNNMTKYFITFFFLTMAKYFKDNFLTQYYENQKKQFQLASELQNLKAQISPHFLFNTMNNFYGLAVEQSPKLPNLMVRLSELLRYSLYETNHIKVPVLNEIAYLKNYIELEKIRLEDTLEFEFSSNIETKEHLNIAPLIFIVFVENAFKHAKNVETDVVKIKINLVITEDNILYFNVKNNCLTNLKDVDYNKNGIGLDNVRRRLNVLYPNGQHELHIEKMGTCFHVKLKIKL
jgi:sensor histidine kinase YesM